MREFLLLLRLLLLLLLRRLLLLLLRLRRRQRRQRRGNALVERRCSLWQAPARLRRRGARGLTVHVAVAHAAEVHVDEDLVVPHRRRLELDQLELDALRGGGGRPRAGRGGKAWVA